MVYQNGFGVKVITNGDQDKLKRGRYNYVALENNSEYELQLTNDRSTDAMAEVYIEGEHIGTWFIPQNDSITIDRPATVARKFVFFREHDRRAIRAGVTPGEFHNGLIKVVFYPKKQQYIIASPLVPHRATSPRLSTTSSPRSLSPAPSSPTPSSPTPSSPRQLSSNIASLSMVDYESGATVLGRHSHQRFSTMRRFSDNEIDWKNKTEIVIRLIAKSDNIFTVDSQPFHRDYIAVKEVSSPIPPRIDYY